MRASGTPISIERAAPLALDTFLPAMLGFLGTFLAQFYMVFKVNEVTECKREC
jgi:hypothetical protein